MKLQIRRLAGNWGAYGSSSTKIHQGGLNQRQKAASSGWALSVKPSTPAATSSCGGFLPGWACGGLDRYRNRPAHLGALRIDQAQSAPGRWCRVGYVASNLPAAQHSFLRLPVGPTRARSCSGALSGPACSATIAAISAARALFGLSYDASCRSAIPARDVESACARRYLVYAQTVECFPPHPPAGRGALWRLGNTPIACALAGGAVASPRASGGLGA